MTTLKKIAKISLLSLLVLLALTVAVGCDTNESSSVEETTQAPCDHKTVEWTVDLPATCTAEGSTKKICKNCNAVLETAKLEKLAHTEQKLDGKAATCSEKGLTEGKKCSVCNAVLVEQKEIATIPHTEALVESKKPTCEDKGLTEGKKCSVCNTVIVAQNEIEALGHSESDWIIDKAAEIGVDGSRHKECIRCGEISTTEKIDALTESHVHEGESWIESKPATCSEEGEKQFICSCGKVMETSSIAKIDHTEVTVLGKSPTCIEMGLTDGKKCSVCGTITVEQTPIATSSHTATTVPGQAPTCTEWGATESQKCSVCSYEIVAPQLLPPKGHTFVSGCCSDCGAEEPHGIWIVDGLGKPVNDVIVKIMKDGELVKMYPYKGEFLPFDIETGTYTLELDLEGTGENYVYDQSALTITPDNRSANIRLFKTVPEETCSLFVGSPIEKDYDAYYITEGSYKVSLTPNDYTFFVFAPKSAAIYTLTYECDTDLKISYHGGTFFVQGNDLSESSSEFAVYENGLAASVYAGNIGGEMVFAIKSTTATECIFNIENAGDPGTRLVDKPWTPCLEDEDKVKEQLNLKPNGTYTVIDVTNMTISAVFNEEDGYYHLNSKDGPIIFIDLTTDSKFVSSIQKICGNQRMGAYIYDINGDFIEKRSYNELFLQYGMPDNADEKVSEPIRIPLTQKLAEAVKTFGDKNGWWSDNADTNIFTRSLLGASYNKDIAWLLYCGYYAE